MSSPPASRRPAGARARVVALRARAPDGTAPDGPAADGPVEDGPRPGAALAPDASGPVMQRRVRAVPRTGSAGRPALSVVGGWVPEAGRSPRHAAADPRTRGRTGTDATDDTGATDATGDDDPRANDSGADAQDANGPDGDSAVGDAGTDGACTDAAVGASTDDAGAGDGQDGPAWRARLVRRGPWGALAERWVPEPLRGARVYPGRRGAVLLGVVAAVAAIAAAVGVWWGRPQPRPVAPVALAPATTGGAFSSAVSGRPGAGPAQSGGASPVAGSTLVPGPGPAGVAGSAGPGAGGTTAPAGPTPTARPSGPIVVSVTGSVRHPGVVTLPAGARVADAIQAAGGPLHIADLTGLNLAAHLSDGDSVVVAGRAGSAVNPESTAPAGHSIGAVTGTGAVPGPVDLNTADQAALERLPGVGPVTAAAIIAWRTDHGPFTSVEQLQAVSGIGPITYAQIAPHATV